MNERSRNFVLSICAALIGFAAGYFSADDSSEIQKLREEVDSLKTTQLRGQRQAATRFWGGRSTPRAGTTSVLLVTNKLGEAPSDLLARAKVTAEDMEATRSLETRRAQGEFILRNERPLFRKIQEYDFE